MDTHSICIEALVLSSSTPSPPPPPPCAPVSNRVFWLPAPVCVACVRARPCTTQNRRTAPHPVIIDKIYTRSRIERHIVACVRARCVCVLVTPAGHDTSVRALVELHAVGARSSESAHLRHRPSQFDWHTKTDTDSRCYWCIRVPGGSACVRACVRPLTGSLIGVASRRTVGGGGAHRTRTRCVELELNRR